MRCRRRSAPTPRGSTAFSGLADGTYWVVVDSKALDANTNVWVEQTYGSAGAVRYNGAYSYLGSAGAMFGGMEADGANSSDNFGGGLGLTGAEHVTRVTISGASVTNRDSGFSANVVTNVLGGDTRDDDLAASPRTVQGSLRQFIQNANALAGANAMVFVPAVNPNVDGGDGLGNGNDYWRLSVTNALPQITGANGASTTIDGTAFGFTYGATGIAVRDDNAGLLGDTARFRSAWTTIALASGRRGRSSRSWTRPVRASASASTSTRRAQRFATSRSTGSAQAATTRPAISSFAT